MIFLTLINCGAIMEQKRWVFYLEFSRLALAGIAAVLMYPHSLLVTSLLVAGSLLLYYYERIKEYYLRLLYMR
jgi:alkylglycerol monooxygenase